MGYKKHNWVRWGGGGTVIEIKILDETGTKMDFFRANNNEDVKRILKIIKTKYNLGF